MSNDTGSKLTCFIVGLGIGALVGTLIARKPGEETREYLVQKSEEGHGFAQRKARELRERTEDLYIRRDAVRVAAGPHGPGDAPPDEVTEDPLPAHRAKR